MVVVTFKLHPEVLVVKLLGYELLNEKWIHSKKHAPLLPHILWWSWKCVSDNESILTRHQLDFTIFVSITLQSRQEEKGSSMTNTGPLVRMKKAIQKLREDRNQMELRIGVVAHTLMMSEMRQKNLDDNDDSNDDSDGPVGSDSD